MKQLFISSFICLVTFMHGALGADFECLGKIGNDADGSFLGYLIRADNSNTFSGLTGQQEAQTFVDEHRDDLAEKIAADVMKHCIKPNGTYDLPVLNDMVLEQNILIPFTFKNKKYDITVSTDLLFANMKISFPKGILLANNPNWQPGQEIAADSMPDRDYIDSECSSRGGSTTAYLKPVDTVSDSVFGKTPAEYHNFVFDNPAKHSHLKVFPGLLLHWTNGWVKRNAFVFDDNTNYKQVYSLFTTFADGLQNTACASSTNYPNHTLYLVDLIDTNITSTTKAKKLNKVRIASKPILLNATAQ